MPPASPAIWSALRGFMAGVALTIASPAELKPARCSMSLPWLFLRARVAESLGAVFTAARSIRPSFFKIEDNPQSEGSHGAWPVKYVNVRTLGRMKASTTMTSWRRRCLLVVLMVLGAWRSASGGEYTDPSGFSFTYPDGWAALTLDSLADSHASLPDEIKTWLANNNVDLNRMAVLLLRESQDEYRENLNVVVSREQISFDDPTVMAVSGEIIQQMKAMGVTADGFQRRVEKVGSHDALVLEYQALLPGMPHAVRQKQVLFPGGGNTYIVTCTSKSDTFDLYRPVFDQMLTRFRVPRPTVPPGFDWMQVLKMGAIGGLVGGLLGGLRWIAGKVFVRTKPKL